MKTERWRAGSTLAVALNSTGIRTSVWNGELIPPLGAAAGEEGSPLVFEPFSVLPGAVKSSIVLQGISSQGIPKSSQAAAFPVTQRR